MDIFHGLASGHIVLVTHPPTLRSSSAEDSRWSVGIFLQRAILFVPRGPVPLLLFGVFSRGQ